MAKKVLIGEDERPIGNALQLKLTHSGFDVKFVTDGQQVLDEMKSNKYDVLLLDLMMPKKGGFDVLHELKERKDKTPVIVLSNLGQEEDKDKCIDLGAIDYFVKSNTPLSDIVKHVKKVLG